MKSLLAAGVLLLTICAVYAADLPEMKEGLWSIHMETVSQPGDKKGVVDRSICRNHESDASVREREKKQQSRCKVINDTYIGGKFESETECVVGGTTIHTKATATKSGENAAHAVTHATYNPAFAGTAETTMIMDQKYVGACPAGVGPGDIIEANGTIKKALKH